MRAAPLRADHQPQLTALLGAEPVTHMHLLDACLPRLDADPRRRWWGAWTAGGELRAVVLAFHLQPGAPASSMVPGGDPLGARLIGRLLAGRGGASMLIGPRDAVDALWEGLGFPGFRIAYDQRLFVCEAVAPGPRLPVRPPVPDELDHICALHRAMLWEDLGLPPGRIDQPVHRARMAERMAEGRLRVDASGGPARFLIDLGTLGPLGTHVGSTFLAPEARGQGEAAGRLRAVLDELLGRVPRVTLHANEQNDPAVRLYERVGFQRAAAFRLMSV